MPAIVRQFTESVSFDWRFYRQDIAGSIAHAKGLAKAGIITKAEAGKIVRGLRAIECQIETGQFAWDPALEDVHMNIEAALGAAGKKLHTARSRNDQVATDLRLWVKEAIADCGFVEGVGGVGGEESGCDPAGVHAHATGAAGIAGAPSVGVRRDAGAGIRGEGTRFRRRRSGAGIGAR